MHSARSDEYNTVQWLLPPWRQTAVEISRIDRAGRPSNRDISPKFICTILTGGQLSRPRWSTLVVSAEAFSPALSISPWGQTPLISLSVPQDANIRRGAEIYNSCTAGSAMSKPGYFYNLIWQLKIDKLLIAEHRNPSGNQLRDVTLS